MARWTRDELLLALGLYFETPFGKQHKGHTPIIKLAEVIGRTPSAVAMKLSNFTSLDPSEAERGISGLTGASNLDRNIWDEFQNDREELVDSIERLREAHDEGCLTPIPTGPTTQEAVVMQRRHQQFFRRVVVESYGVRCCVTGMSVPELLRASHIVPWRQSVEHRLNPRNGLCLSATVDAAFDRGLIGFDSQYRLMVGQALREHRGDDAVQRLFIRREGQSIALPEKNLPDLELLQWHAEDVFH